MLYGTERAVSPMNINSIGEKLAEFSVEQAVLTIWEFAAKHNSDSRQVYRMVVIVFACSSSARLAMLWKINNNMVHADLIQSKLLPLSERQRQGHDQQFVQIQCRTQYRQFSFLPRSIREWNELPPEAVAARTLDTFVSRVREPSSNTSGCFIYFLFLLFFFLFLRNADPQ